MPKEIKKRITKKCICCGKAIHAVVYTDHTVRGGHYFGKIPLCTKAEYAKSRKAGTRSSTIDGHVFQVLIKDPKPYAYAEYWECPKCYWYPNKK